MHSMTDLSIENGCLQCPSGEGGGGLQGFETEDPKKGSCITSGIDRRENALQRWHLHIVTFPRDVAQFPCTSVDYFVCGVVHKRHAILSSSSMK